MPNETVYVFDEKSCKLEGMTKEQIIAAIAEATGETPQSIDTAFITMIKESNRQHSLHIWRGTQAEYNALTTIDADTFYIITDDSTIDDLRAELEELEGIVAELGELEHDTGWIDVKRTTSTSAESTIGKYRVKGGIAYFDLKYNPTLFNVAMNDSYTLPVLLDVSGSEQGILVYTTTVASGVVITYATLSNSGGETTITIPNGGGSAASSLRVSFCYPVAPTAS